MKPDDELPPDHWSVVPGEAWRRHWLGERKAGAARYQAEISRQSPDPRYVDPPKFKD